MLYIGIDQKLLRTGVVILTGSGAILYSISPKPGSTPDRLVQIQHAFSSLLNRFPTIAAAMMESHSFGSPSRKYDLGAVWGILVCELQKREIEILPSPAPKQLKKFVTGNRNATKEEVEEAIKNHYGIGARNDDEADAAGLALMARAYKEENWDRRCEGEVIKALKEKA